MGNEASQEGEGVPQQSSQQRPVPPLVTQQSMPLPAPQGAPAESPSARRGSAGPQLMMRRASSAGAAAGAGASANASAGAGPKRGSIVEIPTELDLSNLSEEERATILSVMARAQSMEEEHPPSTAKEEVEKQPEKDVEKCSLCRASPKEGSCVECGALCCRKCSKAIPSGKKHVWMCVRCVDRYPQLQSSINKQEAGVTNEEVDKKRRASEVTGPPQQQGPPPSRGRSDSLPSQEPRMQQRTHPSQSPQQRPDLQQQRQPNGSQGPRHQGPQQNFNQRPQHPQQVRPRYPNDQQKAPYTNGQPRPQHPNDPRFQHPNDQQRLPQPNDQQRLSHRNEQIRGQHTLEQQDKLEFSDQQSQKQQINNQQRHHLPDSQKPQLQMEHRAQPPSDSRNYNADQRIQQSPQQSRNHSTEQQRSQNASSNRDQLPNERKTTSIENKTHSEYGKPNTEQRHQQRPQHPMEQSRSQHPVDQPRPQHLVDQPRPQHPSDQYGPSLTKEHQKQFPADPRNFHSDPRMPNSISQQPEQQRLQYSAEEKLNHVNMQAQMKNSQHPDDYPNSQHSQHSSEKDAAFFQQQDPLKPRPQHPLVQPNQKLPPEGTVQSYPQKPHIAQEYSPQRPQGSDIPQITPPPRNQRIRQPPEQQMIPRPQHPQQSPHDIVHYPQDLFKNNTNLSEKSMHEQHPPDKFQMQQEFTSEKPREQNQLNKHQKTPERINSKQLNGPQYPPDSGRNGSNNFPQDSARRQNFVDERNSEECWRPDMIQKQFNEVPEVLPQEKNIFPQKHISQNRQQQRSNELLQNVAPENDKNGMYVSLNEQIPCQSSGIVTQEPQRHQIRNDNSTAFPPATLPRTKPPEVPQPASRSTRRDKLPGNQTLPRTGTNPFGTDTNPFRRESFPSENIDAGEYVTVAPRRGSLDDRIKFISSNDQNRLNDPLKPSETSTRQKDRHLKEQDSFEKIKNSQEGEDKLSSYNRHLDEEQRRNAINSGISAADSSSRRQLPTIDKQKKQSVVPYAEQDSVPPVPKARTSLPEGYSSVFGEGRNGIPRTVPLTSLTLQQQNDQVQSHLKQTDDINQIEKENSAINDLSQHKQESSSLGSLLQQDQQKIRDDLVHPNIVDNSINSGSFRSERNDDITKSKPPPTQPRTRMDPQRDQSNNDPYRSKAQGQQRWSESPQDQRKSKPIHPNDNLQDMAGYQDEEEEENIDDYFQMIENAITDRKPQLIVGGRKTSDIQRQLFSKEADKDHAKAGVSDYTMQKGQVSATLRQIDAYNQNVMQQGKNMSSPKNYPNAYGQKNTTETVKEKNDLNIYEQDKIHSTRKDFYDADEDNYSRDRKDSQYIIQPAGERTNHQVAQEDSGKAKRDGSKGYDKLLLHELTPDTRQPSAKHYLEEHKTQPVSYEAFSSAKAMQQMQTDPRQQQYSSQQQKPYQQQTKDLENRNQQNFYYSEQSSGSNYQSTGQSNDPYSSSNDSQKVQSSGSSKPSAIDIQNQKKAKTKPDPQDWSPVSDLSPILDVSPSIEAAEQELMEKFQEKVVDDQDMDIVDDDDSRLLRTGGIPRAKSGTISGMLEEFTRALGLPGTSPIDDSGIKLAVSPTSLAMSPISNVGSSVTAVSTLQKEYQEGFGSPQKTTGGSPQKTPAQPTTPRRSHRRLPQPTVEQMQAAVAMAAQGPRDKPQQPVSTTTGAAIFGVEANKGTPGGRPVSPVMPWKSPEMNQSFEQAYNKQQGQPAQETQATVPPSPAPRTQPRNGNSAQKASDIASTATLINSQDIPTAPVRRLRSASYGGSPSSKPSEDIVARLNGGGSSSPHGTNNVFSDIIATTVGSPQTPSTPRDKTGDSSDTQSEAESIKSVRLRRKLPNLPQDQRSSPSPTKKTLEKTKNGIDQQDFTETEPSGPTPASAVTITTTVTTALETSRQYSPLTALGTPSPQPIGGSLSPLLGRKAELSRTPSPGGEAGTKLPQYMQNLKQQLRDELKAVTEERKIMLEQRGKEKGEGEGAKTPQPIQVQHSTTEVKEISETVITTQPVSPYMPQSISHTKVSQAQQIIQAQLFPQISSQMTPTPQPQLQTQVKTLQQATSVSPYQTQILSPYRTHPPHHNSNQSLYQSSISNIPQQSLPQTPYQAQTYAQQEQYLYQALQDSGRRTPQPAQARTPLPDAVPQYATMHRVPDDDITIMTTATTTVVSASEQWHDGKRHRQPPTTTMAPSTALMGSSVESLRRLQSKMSPQPSPKKGRRRHTSEITVPPFPQMEHHEMAHTLHHPPRQQQPPPQYIQYYNQLQGQNAVYRSMEFKPLDSHVRATDLLRSSASRYGGSLGSGLGSTEALYQGRRVLNNKLQDYVTDNRIMEQQQRLMGPDAYFQTLNNEINRLRRSSENLHRDTIYDKPVWGGPPVQPQPPVVEIRTSPQTTDRRKRKEKKSRKPRSWHPSPYVSEDEDDQLTREEKKVKIKAEIARRRQQIEENMILHDELCKLAERRDRLDAGRPGSVAYVPSPTGSVSYMTQESNLGPTRSTAQDGDDTSSVLKAIDEILRKDLYSGPLSRSAWATYANPTDVRANEYYQQGYLTMPGRGRYDYTPTSEIRSSSSWYEDEASQQPPQQQQQQHPQHGVQYFQEAAPDPETAMDESIARIASTFPTDEPPDILLSATPGHFSPEITPAMPLLPDMPTRSRKLLENLGSSPIQPSRSGSAQSLYQERSGDEECTDDGSLGHRIQESSSLLGTQQRKTSRAPVSKTSQKYEFPVKRILLTRDPRDRSVSGNGLGMKVVGGKEVPGSNGMIGAYVAKIFPGGVVETLGEVKEGDQVLEWNGIPLTGRTYEEVQRIIASSADEVEIVIRCDLNMLETMSRQRRSSPGMGTSGGPRGDGTGSGGPPGRGPSPAHSPYSPSSRGQSPALSKRGMGGGGTTGGGGGNVVGVTTHSSSIPTSLSEASSYENLQTPDQGFGHRFGRNLLNTAPTSRSVVSVFAPSADWPDIYDSAIYSSPQSPDDFLDDNFQTHWQSGTNIEEMQFQVCCGPRTAIVYVPIIPVRPMVKNTTPALLNRNHFTRRSVDHIDDYEPLLKNGWRSNDKTLGFYDLLRPRNSLGKVSLYLNGIKEKAEQYDLKKKNGMCRVTEIKEETRERPRAPSDLPGLKPVFVNDWKGHRKVYKVKHEENDDNNNTKTSNNNQSGEKPRKPCVGSSPEATPYNILPKGCRGSLCVIL